MEKLYNKLDRIYQNTLTYLEDTVDETVVYRLPTDRKERTLYILDRWGAESKKNIYGLYLFIDACKTNHLDLVKLFIHNTNLMIQFAVSIRYIGGSCPWPFNPLVYHIDNIFSLGAQVAGFYGRLDIIKYILDNRHLNYVDDVYNRAYVNAQWEIMKYVVEHMKFVDRRIISKKHTYKLLNIGTNPEYLGKYATRFVMRRNIAMNNVAKVLVNYLSEDVIKSCIFVYISY